MHPRGVVLVAAFLLVGLVAGRASAWQEAHEVGDDLRVQMQSDGSGVVDHLFRWHVVRGPLKAIDVAGIDARVPVEADVAIAADDGRTLSAHASRQNDGTVHVAVDDPRGLGRGSFVFDVRWKADLAAIGALVRDGATWRLALASPPPSDGVDLARLTLDVPAAPDSPQPIVSDTGLVDDGQEKSIRRDATRDVLDLVRPHVARNEAVTWTIRIDPRAFGVATAKSPSSTPGVSAPPDRERLRLVFRGLGLLALAGLFGGLVAAKTRAVEAMCKTRKAAPRALLPLAGTIRAALGAMAFAGGIAAQVQGRSTLGGALVALALLAAAQRAPKAENAPRGPGRWLILRPADAFARRAVAGDWFDVGTRPGAIVAGIGVAAMAAVAWAASAGLLRPAVAWVVLVDAGAFAPLFWTGRAAQLRPDAAVDAGPWLSGAYRRLLGFDGMRVVPWGRVVLGGAIDELRLLLAPRASLPGFVGVELGLAWSATPVGWTHSPEVLVRVLDATPASARLARCAPGVRAVPGRRADERVVRLTPRTTTRGAVVALARALVEALADRRLAAGPSWAGPERRRTAEAAAAPPVGRDAHEISAFQRAC